MERDLTYKIKCRSCGKITKMYLGAKDQITTKMMRAWAVEHSTFPFEKQCSCDNGSMLFHDLVSYDLLSSLNS